MAGRNMVFLRHPKPTLCVEEHLDRHADTAQRLIDWFLKQSFVDALNLFWVAESWGGHLSLVLPVHAKREVTPMPDGYVLRFHAGLEDYQDLLRDLNQATGCL